MVGMRLFAVCITTLVLTIYSTLNLVVTTVLNVQIRVIGVIYGVGDLIARASALREAILIRDCIFARSNANQLSINELNNLIESLELDLK